MIIKRHATIKKLNNAGITVTENTEENFKVNGKQFVEYYGKDEKGQRVHVIKEKQDGHYTFTIECDESTFDEIDVNITEGGKYENVEVGRK